MTHSRPGYTHQEGNRQRTTLTTFGLGTFPLMAMLIGTHSSLAQEVHYPLGIRVDRFALADLNHDGATDVALAAPVGVGVMFNDGHGGLLSPVWFGDAGPYYIAAGDVNGDRAIDLVTHSRYGSDIRVYLNNGDGTFALPHATAGWGQILGFELADVDGDSDLDLVFNVYSSDGIAFSMNDGDGTFTPGYMYDLPYQRRCHDMTVGDLDNDGDLDIAAGVLYTDNAKYYSYNRSEMLLLMNTGGGMSWVEDVYTLHSEGDYQAGPDIVVAGDFDGNSYRDVLVFAYDHVNGHVKYHIDLLMHHRDGTWKWNDHIYYGTSEVKVISAADVNGDGALDFVTAGYGSLQIDPIHAYLNAGDLTFHAQGYTPGTPLIPTDQALTDITGDGVHDLVLLSVDYNELIVIAGAPDPSRPVLTCSDLRRGTLAEFTVTSVEPGERVHFIYSLDGPGHSTGVSLLGGLVLDLNEPLVRFATAVADKSGTAVLSTTVNPHAPLQTVAFQAVVRGRNYGDNSVKSTYRAVAVTE